MKLRSLQLRWSGRLLHFAVPRCEVFPSPQKADDAGSAGRYTPFGWPPQTRLRNEDPSMYLDIFLIVVVAFAFYDWFQPKSQPGWIANAKSLVVLKNLRDDIISMSPDIEAWYSRYKKQKEAGDPPA